MQVFVRNAFVSLDMFLSSRMPNMSSGLGGMGTIVLVDGTDKDNKTWAITTQIQYTEHHRNMFLVLGTKCTDPKMKGEGILKSV
jgi:hypothetical protein